MANVLNFNNVKKRYLTVTLPDEQKTMLMIGTPTKAIMDNLILLKSGIEALEEDETNPEALDDLYNACAKIMSRNKSGIKITTEYLSELFDFEDILLFFSTYMNFLSELTNVKN